MSGINWIRLILATLIAAVIAFLTDGVFHERVVGADWKALHENLGVPELKHNAFGIFYFALFELGRGFLSMVLYVFMRDRCKPGPKTAACAGVIAWIAFSVTGPAQFIPLGFFSNTLWVKVAAFQLVTSILAAIAGAAVYKETKGQAVHS
ncbi:MAG: hypothetical protein AABM67_00570 [Acidobacteriota bacterium]